MTSYVWLTGLSLLVIELPKSQVGLELTWSLGFGRSTVVHQREFHQEEGLCTQGTMEV
jgi:hypothetical protein